MLFYIQRITMHSSTQGIDMKNDYLTAVEQRLNKEKSKKLILTELESHIDEKIDYYLELGYSKEESEKRAVDEMGEPDDTALPLRGLYDSAKEGWAALLSYVFLVVSVAAPFFFEKFNYAGEYFREVYHIISLDFISMAIIAGYIFVLIFSCKTKDKTLSISAAIALLISNFSGMAVFRPAVYSAVKILLSGFNSYIDNVFAYSYFTEDFKIPLTIGSYIVFSILLVWAVIQWLVIFRQERMLRTKGFTAIIQVAKKVVIVLLCVDFAFASTATVIAAFGLSEKREKLHSERVTMMDEIIYTPFGTLTENLYFRNNGYKLFGVMPALGEYRKEFHEYNHLVDQSVYCGEVGNNAFAIIDSAAFYVRTDYDLPFDALESYMIDADMLRNNSCDNLQEFIDEGWYIKAYQVLKRRIENEESISFSFYTNEFQTGTITFTCTSAGSPKDLRKYNIRTVDYLNDLYGGI